MQDSILRTGGELGLTEQEQFEAVKESLKSHGNLKKVLILPPDFTRRYSGAFTLTKMYYKLLKDTCQVDIMPALGTHDPISEEERIAMYGDEIPKECFFDHNWRDDVVKIGEVPAEFIREVSEGIMDEPIVVEVNKRLVDKSYDLIISIGQVVPHEVVGMANYGKNIFVGCGGKGMIDQTHSLGAYYGMERMMGQDKTPVRKVFDYAEEHFTQDIPLMYVLTVTTQVEGHTAMNGLFIGRKREIFEAAVKVSQEKNINFLDKAPKKIVVYLEPEEFKSTWLGNKSIYRTRMAIADGGELIVLAPGVRKFGEDEKNDAIIREYGYVGRENIIQLVKESKTLQNSMSVAAHLIHGSSDGRFTITYAVDKISREEIESVGFKSASFAEMVKRYDPAKLKNGFNTMEDGEEIFFISNPALGLWADRERFYQVNSK